MLERTINDPEAMRLWREVYVVAVQGGANIRGNGLLCREIADHAMMDFLARFGDECGRREWEDFKQAQKAGNAP